MSVRDPAASYGPPPGPERHAFQATPEHAAGGPPVVLVPCGAVEQHGPHLPVGTDAWIAGAVATRVARERPGRVLVAEGLHYGCSGHHTAFAGTVTLRVPTFMALVTDVATSLHRDGYRAVFVNGHGGNRGPLTAAVQDLFDGGVPAFAVSYFELIEADLAEALPDHHDSVGHACALETSIVMHLWPDTVHGDRVPGPGAQGRWPDPFLFPADRVIHARGFADLAETGVVGKPRRATAALGRRLFEAAVLRTGAVVDRIAALPPPRKSGEDT